LREYVISKETIVVSPKDYSSDFLPGLKLEN
jgi:hypothetical protein